jgi:hypothetical protein
VTSLYTRVLKTNIKLPVFFLAVLLLEAVYYNIVFDILLITFLFSTAFALGSFFDVKGRLHAMDKILVQLCVGCGISGFIIWLTTFHNLNYKSLFLTLSFAALALRYRQLRKAAQYCQKVVLITHKRNKLFFPILLTFVFFYIMNASYPILRSDASVKHLAIPFNILNKTNWDYNVIEGEYFGDYALLSHMYSLYLLALGGTKALQLFVAAISFMSLLMLLRVSIRINTTNLYVNAISLLYLTTPVVFMFSNNLFVDIFPLFFFLAILLLVTDFRSDIISQNIFAIAFLMGSAIFAKQSAMYFLAPTLLFIACSTLLTAFKKGTLLPDKAFFMKVIGSIFLFLLPFVPSMLVIWHKTGNPFFPYFNATFGSVYFEKLNFVDQRWEEYPLGLNLRSFLSMIFHSGRHWEWADRGIGYFLLLLPVVPIMLFVKRNKTAISLFVFTVLSYWVSTFGSSNLRYKMGMIALSIPLCSLVIVTFSRLVRHAKVRAILFYGAVAALIAPHVYYIVTPQWLTFSPRMLTANQDLTLVENEAILSAINRKGIRVLSNNDQARGAFRGEFYNMSWYNTFLMNKVVSHEIPPVEFMKAFDYYLIRKEAPYYYPEFFSLDKKTIREVLEPFGEDKYCRLFKIRDEDVLRSEIFKRPVAVTAEKPETREFANEYKAYKIIIEAEKTHDDESSGRFQINWADGKGSFAIFLFKLHKGRNIYTSPIIEDTSAGAKKGVLFLVSHDETPILIHSYRLVGLKRKSTFLQKALDIYDKTWPYLSK